MTTTRDYPLALQLHRDRLRYTHRQCADLLGISLRTWRYWHDGVHIPGEMARKEAITRLRAAPIAR